MCTVAQALKQEGRQEGRRDGLIESLCRMINGGLSESFIIGLGYTKDEYDSALKIAKNLSA